MHEFAFLRDLVVILAVGVAVVLVLRHVGVPSIAGFITAGAIIGPKALAVVSDEGQVEVLAEIGVVLLLFSIGLELSLARMRRLWRLIVFGGAIQVGLTIAIITLLGFLVGMRTGSAVFLGCVIAVSSTAIVLSGLRQRGEVEAPHGQLTLGILVFQDLCVVPMLLVIPLLAGGPGGGNVLVPLLKAALILVGVVITARLIVPPLLHYIASTRQRDLFVLTVFLICIGTAWVVSLAGVSLALGAFLAGLVVAGSEYRHQALADLIPFREVLTSFFFVSVGMLIDPAALLADAGRIVLILVAIIFGKFMIVWITGQIMRLPIVVSVLAGTALAQAGEFSFVLLAAERDFGLLGPLRGDLAMAIILSMLITPLMILAGPHVAAGVGRLRGLTRWMEVRTPDELPPAVHISGHVIVAGYGVTGQDLSVALHDIGIPYMIVDINAENVRNAIQRVEPAYFGDVTNAEVLEHLGIAGARELVIAINDPGAAQRALRAARRLAPHLPITVRTQYVADIPSLIKAGATDVVAAELEASAEVTARVLERCRVGREAVDPHLERIRERTEE